MPLLLGEWIETRVTCNLYIFIRSLTCWVDTCSMLIIREGESHGNLSQKILSYIYIYYIYTANSTVPNKASLLPAYLDSRKRHDLYSLDCLRVLRIRQWFRRSRYTVAYTGAGISTAAGIKDCHFVDIKDHESVVITCKQSRHGQDWSFLLSQKWGKSVRGAFSAGSLIPRIWHHHASSSGAFLPLTPSTCACRCPGLCLPRFN